nr:YihY/virulence factor BrkB family protein [Tissierella sp.]
MEKVIDKARDKFGDKKWITFIEQLIYRYEDDGVSEIGAQLTYYLTLAIFPFIIFFLSILQFTPLADVNILQRLLSPLPAETRDLFYNLIKGIIDDGSVALLSFGAIGSIWSSSNGVMAVMKAINRALDLDESRPYFKLKGLSILFTIGLFFILIIAFTVLVFGEVIFNKIFVSYTWPTLVIWKILKILIPISFMVLVFTILYKYSPSIKDEIKIKFSESIPGAIFASILWVVLSAGFSFYVSNFGNYSKTYGSLGGIIAFLIWLYMSSIVIVLGAEVNATLLSMQNKKGKRIKMIKKESEEDKDKEFAEEA